MLKVHSNNNVFYLLSKTEVDKLKNSKSSIKDFVKNLCLDGSDGVLIEDSSQIAQSKMLIYNADGSEAEMCGNGLRCFARYILEKYNLKKAWIETKLKTYEVIHSGDFYGQIGISILMTSIKKVYFDELRYFNGYFSESYMGYDVSNPHIVRHTKNLISKESISIIGKKAQDIFKHGINVNAYQVLDTDNIYVRTYERGVGLTSACGTGMTACSVDYAIEFNAFNKDINIFCDGGLVCCKVNRSNGGFNVRFTGHATFIGESTDGHSFNNFTDEKKNYETFYKSTRAMIHKYKL